MSYLFYTAPRSPRSLSQAFYIRSSFLYSPKIKFLREKKNCAYMRRYLTDEMKSCSNIPFLILGIHVWWQKISLQKNALTFAECCNFK